MAIREGRWDCPTCGTRGLLGRQTGCAECGTPRSEDVRFYLPDDAEAVGDAERLAQARAGADWLCEHCGAGNRATAAQCTGCGAPRGESEAREVRQYALADLPGSGEKERAVSPPPSTRPARRRGGVKTLAAVGAVVAGIAWWNQPKDVTATVADKAWERSVQVEEERTVREEGWQLPSGGRLLDSFRAIREYRNVVDHYETRSRQVSERVQVGTRTYTCGQRDLGNGYFEDVTCTEPEYETRYHTETYEEPIYRREPVYATKYRYEIERWLPDSLAVQRGGAGDPAWPEPRLGRRERLGPRTEKYVLTFRDEEGNTFTKEVPLAEFSRWDVGEPVQLKVQRSGKEIEIVGGAEAPAAP
ncbi:MAG TPA: zinc finger protein [Longimicrobiaceae bacterium]|nr:zinc finger protein [Longimicrobiaceae bacterium]